MCEPTTILAVGGLAAAGLGMAGATATAMGQAQEGADAERKAKDNAFLARMAATDARARGEQAGSRIRAEARHLEGEQRVAAAANGLDVNSSPSLIATLVGSQQAAELDVLTARNNAAREAWGYETQADQMLKAGRKAKEAANWQSFSTFLGGAMTAGQKAFSAGVKAQPW